LSYNNDEKIKTENEKRAKQANRYIGLPVLLLKGTSYI